MRFNSCGNLGIGTTGAKNTAVGSRDAPETFKRPKMLRRVEFLMFKHIQQQKKKEEFC
jgi:hypothetical protein